MEGLCCNNRIRQNPETWLAPARRYLQWMNLATPREHITARPAGGGSARSTPETKRGIIALSARAMRAARDKPVQFDQLVGSIPILSFTACWNRCLLPSIFLSSAQKHGRAEIGFAPTRLPNCGRTERTSFSIVRSEFPHPSIDGGSPLDSAVESQQFRSHRRDFGISGGCSLMAF